ncbi:MAG: endonuclease NucS domain-containing protein [Lyngbya sp.]|nr:endonuclease NucS domain-containing protein [Lyngbya sp.]
MLRKNEGIWKFNSEADLETFVWDNLENLFNLQPLKRQFSIRGEFCDILAIAENKALVIIELKNIEDRYIVQQLTRYYDRILSEKPFQADLDYTQSIHLLALAPSFHRHNLIDRKYNKLKIDFLWFEIRETTNQISFNLKNQSQELIASLKILDLANYKVPQTQMQVSLRKMPKIPKALARMLESQSTEIKNIILNLRERILSFDDLMGEKSTSVTLTYGRMKQDGQLCKPTHLLCCGFYQSNKNQNLELFVYLPYSFAKNVKLNILTEDWKIALKAKIPSRYSSGGKCHSIDIMYYLKWYEKMTGKSVQSNSIETLVDLALEEWKARCGKK